MSTEPLEQAITSTRSVLTAVSKEQLGDTTPCAAWKVSDLINHIVGGQYFFEAMAKGEPPPGGNTDFSATDFLSAFDEGAQRSVRAFQADGVMEKMLTLPFGQMPGAAFVGIAATDTFTHGWDLAKATGQATDLAPALAGQLLAGAKQAISPAFRSPEGTVFGPEQPAPAGASMADQLAAFLGRKV
ncbi:MAG TPA: TIGR03086 family metal-binding protein [Acidimicrobiales bacterium]